MAALASSRLVTLVRAIRVTSLYTGWGGAAGERDGEIYITYNKCVF